MSVRSWKYSGLRGLAGRELGLFHAVVVEGWSQGKAEAKKGGPVWMVESKKLALKVVGYDHTLRPNRPRRSFHRRGEVRQSHINGRLISKCGSPRPITRLRLAHGVDRRIERRSHSERATRLPNGRARSTSSIRSTARTIFGRRLPNPSARVPLFLRTSDPLRFP
jgi:hypothetical protein